MSRFIGVYGSLRSGGVNHPRLRRSAPPATPEAIVRIPGRLYSLGAYCCAVPLAEGEDGEIVTEIYEVGDDVFLELDDMERAVGYVGIETAAATPALFAREFIVWYLPAAPGHAARVDGGDWVAFCRSNQRPY